ncbi:MAG: signal peptidase II [Lachnospiraceae bacterium]|nr:signal peptidase II [Lachnospiraceae bacterium]
MKATVKRYIIHFVLLFLLVGLDQFTKIWARGSLKGGTDLTVLPGILSFSYLENRGAVWGIFQNKTTFLILLTAAIFVVVLFLYFKLPAKKRYNPARLLLVFIAAGGLGNIIDRILFGYVTDFIRFDFINFPVFNVADMYITVCEVIALVLVLFVYRDDLDGKEGRQEESSDGISRF